MTNESANQNWEEPVSFDEPVTLELFPIEHLPTVLTNLVENVADVTQTPIDAAGLASLAMISIAAARKFIVHLTNGEGWKEANNLYTVVAMPPGERKSAVFSILAKPIEEYEYELQKQLFDSKNEHGESRRLKRILADDVTPQALAELLEDNDERIAIVSTEPTLFEMLSHRQYGRPINLDVHLKSFTWDRLTIDRKKDLPIILNKPCLTMCLFAQPSALRGLPDRLIGRGLMGRFLYALPPTARGKRDISLKVMSKEVLEAYRTIIYRLLNFDPSVPISLTLSSDALDLFQDYRSNFEPSLGEGGDLSHEFMSSWTERLPGQILRIAATFHVVLEASNGPMKADTLNTIISKDTMAHALAFSNYLISHAKAAFGCIKSDEAFEDALYLLKKFETKRIPQYKRQALWNSVRGKFKSVLPFNEALEVLRARGYIRIMQIKAQKGRNGEIVECHPEIIGAKIRRDDFSELGPIDTQPQETSVMVAEQIVE